MGYYYSYRTSTYQVSRWTIGQRTLFTLLFLSFFLSFCLLVEGLSDVDVDIEIKRLYSHGRLLFLLIIGLSVVEVHNGNYTLFTQETILSLMAKDPSAGH
jgi:hypothetical protein